tara:strand:- start:248 stop:421 length:174 start_codon:yes stop_codon:yes gene_type:complete
MLYLCEIIERKKMTTLTRKYKFTVLLRLLDTKETLIDACSKSGLSLNQATNYLNKLS